MPDIPGDPFAALTDAQIVAELGDDAPPVALDRLGAALAAADPAGPPAAEFARGLAAREVVGSTAIGRGVALPHCRIAGLTRARLAVARSAAGVAFGAPDGEPVHLFVALATPAESPGAHLRLLSELARRLRDGDRIARVLAASTAAEIREHLAGAAATAGVS